MGQARILQQFFAWLNSVSSKCDLAADRSCLDRRLTWLPRNSRAIPCAGASLGVVRRALQMELEDILEFPLRRSISIFRAYWVAAVSVIPRDAEPF